MHHSLLSLLVILQTSNDLLIISWLVFKTSYPFSIQSITSCLEGALSNSECDKMMTKLSEDLDIIIKDYKENRK